MAEQLSVYQQTLREKTRQMKAMASELNMYQVRGLYNSVTTSHSVEQQPLRPYLQRAIASGTRPIAYPLAFLWGLLLTNYYYNVIDVLVIWQCLTLDLNPVLRPSTRPNPPPPQAQVSEYKYEIERLVRELNEVKRKYFEQRRKEQIQGGTGPFGGTMGKPMSGTMGGQGMGPLDNA